MIERDKKTTTTSLIFASTVSNKLKTSFKKHEAELVFSNFYKLTNQLVYTRQGRGIIQIRRTNIAFCKN